MVGESASEHDQTLEEVHGDRGRIAHAERHSAVGRGIAGGVTTSATRFASKAPSELDVDRLDGHLVNTHAAALREHEQFGAAPW